MDHVSRGSCWYMAHWNFVGLQDLVLAPGGAERANRRFRAVKMGIAEMAWRDVARLMDC